MKKIFLLTSEFSNDRAGGFRQERWAEVFLEDGFIVTVFNISGFFSVDTLVFKNIEQLLSYRKTVLLKKKSRSGVREGWAAKYLRKIKHALFLEFIYPSLYLLAFKLNKSGLLKGNKMLMVSSPPFSLGVIAYIFKRINCDLEYVVDMRDAWAMHKSIGGARWVKNKIEKAILINAVYLVTVSEFLAKELKRKYGCEVLVAYNVSTHYTGVAGMDSNEFKWNAISNDIRNDAAKLVYTGSTPAGHYDLETFVNAIELLVIKGKIDNVQFIFVGNCMELEKIIIKRKVLDSYFVFIGHLPQLVVRDIQLNADALIFFGYDAIDNAGVVSTKLFEYLILRKPVLPVNVKVGSDVYKIMDKYMTVALSLETQSEIRDVFDEGLVLEKLPALNVQREVMLGELMAAYNGFSTLLSSVSLKG